MGRFPSILRAAAVLAGLSSAGRTLAEPLELAVPAIVRAGSSFTVTLQATAALQKVQTASFSLAYSGGLTVVGAPVTGDGILARALPERQKVNFVWADLTGSHSGPGVVGTVVFRAPDTAGIEAINLIRISLTTPTGADEPSAEQAARISVVGGGVRCLGDVTRRHKLDVADATLLLRYVVNLVPLSADQKAVADVNHDGVIDLRDVTALLQAIVRGVQCSDLPPR